MKKTLLNNSFNLNISTFILLAIGVFIFSFLQLEASASASSRVEALNNYCRSNFNMSLVDGTDAHVACRVGDPLDKLSSFGYDESFWNALTEQEKATQPTVDHCADIYSQPSTVESCREQTELSTGAPFNPVTIPEPIRSDFSDDSKACNEQELTKDNCYYVEYLVTGINILSALAGMAIVFSIMFAGFQYMTARDNAGQIQQARQRIIWALSALFIFIFMYAFLNFLVPGGVL